MRCLLLLFVPLLLVGCSPFTRLPQYASPGNATTQQFEAITHDPYPLDDLGPPVVGGRPRSYARPIPAPKRNQLFPGTQTIVPQQPLLIPQP